MIKHHPNHALLSAYVAGDLSASICIAISAHAEMCPECKQKIDKLEAQSANIVFDNTSSHIFEDDMAFSQHDFDDCAMIDFITQDSDIDVYEPSKQQQVTVKNTQYDLPRVLNNLSFDKFNQLGKLSRAKINLEDGDDHINLLHIDKDGQVPSHTHQGFEITLLLSGDFHDEMGSYSPGDFILLDNKHTHNPTTTQGCLCLTVANSGPQFTQGLSKLFNPITNYFY